MNNKQHKALPYVIGTKRDCIKKALFGNIFHNCLLCGCELFDTFTGLCQNCSNGISLNDGATCKLCGSSSVVSEGYCANCSREERFFDRAYSYYIYRGKSLKGIIKQLKSGERPDLAQPLAYTLEKLVVKHNLQFDLVCNVPKFKVKSSKRQYNQAELLAKCLCDILQKPLYHDVMVKTVNTRKQEGLQQLDRFGNVANSFGVADKEMVNGKSVLLIDDILTTGSTLSYCARELKRAGATKVVAVTVASSIAELAMEGKNG